MNLILIKSFLRSKGLMLGLILLFIAGIVSLQIGKVFLEKQELTVEKTAEYQSENIERHLNHVEGDIGLLLYYIRFGIVNETAKISGLSIGHRDVHPSTHIVNIRNLEEQKYTTELMNPFYQLLGNMDFSFVLIYLFPLIIIALCFNLLSEEKESGTWKLVLSQSQSPGKVLRVKLQIRLISVLLLYISLLFVAKIYLQIPIDVIFIAFSIVGSLYLIFWFALSWLVISLQRASYENALLLISMWVGLTMIVPAALNALVISIYPIPEAYDTIVDSRDGYHTKWDQPKEPTINKFKEHYPQFSKYEHPEGESFGWFWYFAMQQMGDDEAFEASTAMKGKLRKRDQLTRTLGFLFPTIHTQFALNTLSYSDLGNYLAYLKALEDFHEEKRLYFYPKIFDGSHADEEDWGRFDLEYFKDKRPPSWLTLLIPLTALIVLLLLLAERWRTEENELV